MTPRKSSRAAARRQYLAMSGRELVFALAPLAGQGVPRKVEVEGASDSLSQGPPHPSPLPHSSPDGERSLAYGERESAEVAECAPLESAPTPDPSPRLADARGGREQQESAGEKSDLMARVQALYEDTAVPVREIARLCGVTERTLYKYVRRGGWRRRYVRVAADDASPGAERGERWLRACGHEPVKGAGGRFVPRVEAGRPVAQGLKALDPKAREQASVACAAASARAAKARAKADAAQVWEARLAAINAVSAAMAGYNRFRASRATVRTPMEITADEQMEAHFVDQIAAALDCVRKLKM